MLAFGADPLIGCINGLRLAGKVKEWQNVIAPTDELSIYDRIYERSIEHYFIIIEPLPRFRALPYEGIILCIFIACDNNTGTAPQRDEVKLSVNENLGDVPINTKLAELLKVTNLGSKTITITGVESFNAAFWFGAEIDSCGILKPQQECHIEFVVKAGPKGKIKGEI